MSGGGGGDGWCVGRWVVSNVYFVSTQLQFWFFVVVVVVGL